MTRSPDPRIDHHRNGRLLDDDRDLGTRLDSPVAPDGGAERHDGRRSRFLKALGQHGVGVNVGKDREPLGYQKLGGLEGLNRIGEEVARVGMNLELHPLGEPGGLGEAGKSDGLLGGVGTAGVGEEQVFLRVDELEDVGKGIPLAAQIGPTERHGDDLRSARRKGLAHHLAGGKFSSPQEEP